MAKYNPNGMVIMNQRAPDRGWLLEHSKRANYLTHTFLDQNRETGDFQRETGMPYAVSRLFPFEPHPNSDNIDRIKRYAHERFDDIRRMRDDAQNSNVLFQINNEQGFRRDDFLMYKYMVERSIELNDVIGMVFWNGASGTVTTGFWNQPNQWEEPWALDFIQTMHRYRDVRLPNGAFAYILGVHSYTSQYPLIAMNAGEYRLGSAEFNRRGFKNLWQMHDAFLEGDYEIDWRLAQDHMARNFQGIMKALGWQTTADGRSWEQTNKIMLDDDGNPIICPWILSTEQGFDNMNDVRKVHWDDLVVMSDLDTPRGYRSLMHTWPKDNWFPGRTAGEVMAYCMYWKYQAIYNRTGVHIGGHNYCLGDTSGPKFWWVSFNLWETDRGYPPSDDYFQAMEDPAYQVEINPVFLGEGDPQPFPFQPQPAAVPPIGERTEPAVETEAEPVTVQPIGERTVPEAEAEPVAVQPIGERTEPTVETEPASIPEAEPPEPEPVMVGLTEEEARAIAREEVAKAVLPIMQMLRQIHDLETQTQAEVGDLLTDMEQALQTLLDR